MTLNYDDFIDHVYKLENIFKVYQNHFHSLESEDKWPQYLSPCFTSHPSKHRETYERLATIRIDNEMDKPILIGLRNVHCEEVNDIIVITVHTNK